ncbi:regulatory protein RecX [Rhodocyclus tenuis]|uniref:regulatory protein RecX n=1 Tax=Rhodocyclus tenuis TaxID=1066 RepID=UPI001902C5C5|nr:regulatory protein RecX [Rhodocyclus tenuis]MBK1680348.1 hypothetical protein [Rhodocyclus tenuis]
MAGSWRASAEALVQASSEEAEAGKDKSAGDAASLRERALRLLARRDYPRAELERKLLGYCAALSAAGFAADSADVDDEEFAAASTAAVGALLDQLAARGLLSDSRYAENRVRARAARYGNARLEQELRQRGVEAEVRADALAGCSSEIERASALWRRRFGCIPGDANERARQMRYLAARGFSGDTVRRVLATAADDSDDVREDDEAC